MTKKILFHIETFLGGGTEKVLLELLKNIDKSRYKVILAVTYNLSELEVLSNYLPNDIEFIHLLPENWKNYHKKKRLKKRIRIVEKVIDELLFVPIKKYHIYHQLVKIEKQIDVVVDWDFTLNKYYKIFENKPFIAYSHMRLSHKQMYNESICKGFRRRMLRYDKIVVIADDMMQQFKAVLPEIEHRLVRIYNSFDIDFIYNKSLENIDSQYKSLLEHRYILAIGRLDESQKDFTTLIKSFAKLKKENNIEEKLYILGQGHDEKRLKELCIKNNIENDILFLGFQTNPYVWMRHAVLFVHSSKFEGLPTVIIEAMILKKAIVATNCPTGVAEALVYGKAGRLTSIGNVGELCTGMRDILKDEALANQYIQNSQIKLTEFDAKIVIEQFYSMLESTILHKKNE